MFLYCVYYSKVGLGVELLFLDFIQTFLIVNVYWISILPVKTH